MLVHLRSKSTHKCNPKKHTFLKKKIVAAVKASVEEAHIISESDILGSAEFAVLFHRRRERSEWRSILNNSSDETCTKE